MLFHREPVLFMTLIQAAIILLVSFGLDLTVEQQTAILVFSAALLGLITRQRVSPVMGDDDLEDDTFEDHENPEEGEDA